MSPFSTARITPRDHADGDYADEPMIYCMPQPLPRFGDSYTLIGSWIVDDEACGMGIREDNTLITKDTTFRSVRYRWIRMF